MLAFKFRQTYVNTNVMLLHSWLHQSKYLSMGQVVVALGVTTITLKFLELPWNAL